MSTGADWGADATAALDVSPVAPSGLAEPRAPSCPGMTSGSAKIWLDDPTDLSLVSRPLHCLAGDGSLHGAFVSAIKADAWDPAIATDERFEFVFDEDHLQEVQSYYVVVAMVGFFQPLFELPQGLPAIEIELQKGALMSTSRYRYVPRKIWAGLKGIVPRVLSAQIFGHEYAHHLVMSHAPELDQVLNEALADYLVADFTGRPLIVAIDRLTMPAAVKAQIAAEARRLLERSADNEWTHPQDVIRRGEQCDFLEKLSALLPADQQLLTGEDLQKCVELSAEDRQLVEPHLTSRIFSGALWQLREEIGAQTVRQLVFAAMAARDPLSSMHALLPGLLAADERLFQGVHGEAIERGFAARGISSGG